MAGTSLEGLSRPVLELPSATPEIRNHQVQTLHLYYYAGQHACFYKSIFTKVWAGSRGSEGGGLFLTNAQQVNQGSLGFPWHSSGLTPWGRIQVFGGFW